MLRAVLVFSFAFASLCLPSLAAQHIPGIDGLRVADFPDEGRVEMRAYYVHAVFSSYRNTEGATSAGRRSYAYDQDTDAGNLKAIWMTPIHILGANYGAAIAGALQKNDVSFKASTRPDADLVGQDVFARSLDVSPLILRWDLPRGSVFAQHDLFVPMYGLGDNTVADGALRYWTHMATIGGKLWLDEGHKWTVSGAVRAEFNHAYEPSDDRSEIRYDPGDVGHVELAIGRKITDALEIGAIATHSRQLDEDELKWTDGKWYEYSQYARSFSAGPEIRYSFEKAGVEIGAQYLWDFAVRNGYPGEHFALTLSKTF